MTKFKTRVFRKPGFYVLRFAEGREEQVYCCLPEKKYGKVYSFFTVSENTRDKIPHDFGMYYWVNSYLISFQPTEWRKQTPSEEKITRSKLYRFSRITNPS